MKISDYLEYSCVSLFALVLKTIAESLKCVELVVTPTVIL
jgi:hypothetical protein